MRSYILEGLHSEWVTFTRNIMLTQLDWFIIAGANILLLSLVYYVTIYDDEDKQVRSTPPNKNSNPRR